MFQKRARASKFQRVIFKEIIMKIQKLIMPASKNDQKFIQTPKNKKTITYFKGAS